MVTGIEYEYVLQSRKSIPVDERIEFIHTKYLTGLPTEAVLKIVKGKFHIIIIENDVETRRFTYNKTTRGLKSYLNDVDYIRLCCK